MQRYVDLYIYVVHHGARVARAVSQGGLTRSIYIYKHIYIIVRVCMRVAYAHHP